MVHNDNELNGSGLYACPLSLFSLSPRSTFLSLCPLGRRAGLSRKHGFCPTCCLLTSRRVWPISCTSSIPSSASSSSLSLRRGVTTVNPPGDGTPCAGLYCTCICMLCACVQKVSLPTSLFSLCYVPCLYAMLCTVCRVCVLWCCVLSVFCAVCCVCVLSALCCAVRSALVMYAAPHLLRLCVVCYVLSVVRCALQCDPVLLRRRPFLFGLHIAALVGLTLLLFGEDIVGFLGGQPVGRGYPTRYSAVRTPCHSVMELRDARTHPDTITPRSNAR